MGEVSMMIMLLDDGTRIVDRDMKETSESIEKTTVIYDDEDASVPLRPCTDKTDCSRSARGSAGWRKPTGK